MSQLFDDIQNLQDDIERFNKIIEGDENTTASMADGQVKPSVTKAIADHFTYLSSLVAAKRVAALTLADLQALDLTPYNLGPTDILLGEVVADPTTANNGLYYIVGPSGTWTKSDYDLWDRVARVESYQGKKWLGTSTLSFIGFQGAEEIVDGIMAIRAVGVPDNDNYRITIFAKNDATFGDRFYIWNSSNQGWTLPGDAVPDEPAQAAGPIWIKLTGPTGYFEVLIDYTVMSDGLLLNTADNRIPLNESVFETGEAELRDLKRTYYPYSVFKPTDDISMLVADNIEILEAVKSFYVVSEVSEEYKLVVLSKNDATHKHRVIIRDETSKVWNSPLLDTVGSGITYMECRNNVDRSLVILGVDFSKLTQDKVYINDVSSIWKFSGQQDASFQTRELTDWAENTTVDIRRSDFTDAEIKEIGLAIKGLRYVKGDTSVDLQVQVMAVNDGSFNYDLWLTDGTDTVCRFLGTPTLNANGVTQFIVPEYQGSGIEVEIYIDYNQITSTGVLINGSIGAAPLYFLPGDSGLAVIDNKIYEHVLEYHTAPWLKGSAGVGAISPYLDVVKDIVDVYLENPVAGEEYDLAILTNNDATFDTRFAIFLNGSQVSFGSVPTSNANGLTEITSSSGTLNATIWVDFRDLPEGVLVNNANSPLIIDPDYVSPRGQPEGDETTIEPHPQNLRLSVAGSSITWGSGYIGQSSYVGVVEKFMRTKLATTIMAQALSSSVSPQVFNEAMCYEGTITKFSGLGATMSGEMECDEISLAIARERGNEGACIVELLVDGSVYDTFSTYNEEPYMEGDSLAVTGDGNTVSWDLGKPFTWGHTVTVGGQSKTGSLNQGGYGGTIPPGDDYMIVRKTVDVGGGVEEVRHFITFATAPGNGEAVSVLFNYGESVKPGKSTVGNVGKKIGSGIESSYGDGNIAYDPANPIGLSSGLDFRQTDDRAILTWRFDTFNKRQFSLRIKELDPSATGATPELYLNYVTNRVHYIQNAGIGGFKASDFLDTTGLKTTRQINQFRPSHLVLESATNDDWNTGDFLAYSTRTNQTAAEVIAAESSINMFGLTGAGDNYTVQSSYVDITAIDSFSVTLDPAATYLTIEPGHLLVMGDYSLDNRRLVVRVIDTWDDVNKVATFKKELLPEDFIQHSSLSELVGQPCQVKKITDWETNVTNVVDRVRDSLPGVDVNLATSGIPHMEARRLEGYREKGMVLARTLEAGFVDYYLATLLWTFEQRAPTPLYLDAALSVVSTGASSYQLKQSNSTDLVTYSARNLTVMVDGAERTGGFTFKGGQKKSWTPGTDPMTLGNAIWVTNPLVVEFTSDIPPVGSTIEIFYNSSKWASDDCHPSAIGYNLFGNELVGRVFK